MPADATVECDAIPAAAYGDGDRQLRPDADGGLHREVNTVVEGCGTIVRTWTVTDNCGNDSDSITDHYCGRYH